MFIFFFAFNLLEFFTSMQTFQIHLLEKKLFLLRNNYENYMKVLNLKILQK